MDGPEPVAARAEECTVKVSDHRIHRNMVAERVSQEHISERIGEQIVDPFLDD